MSQSKKLVEELIDSMKKTLRELGSLINREKQNREILKELVIELDMWIEVLRTYRDDLKD